MLQLYAMTIFDAVLAAAYGLHDYLEAGHVITEPVYNNGVCEQVNIVPWSQGELLKHYIMEVSFETRAHKYMEVN